MFIEKYKKIFLLFYMCTFYYFYLRRKFLLFLLFAINMYESLFIYMPSEATITSHQFAQPIP